MLQIGMVAFGSLSVSLVKHSDPVHPDLQSVQLLASDQVVSQLHSPVSWTHTPCKLQGEDSPPGHGKEQVSPQCASSQVHLFASIVPKTHSFFSHSSLTNWMESLMFLQRLSSGEEDRLRATSQCWPKSLTFHSNRTF